MSQKVICKIHGEMDYALICTHLAAQTHDDPDLNVYLATPDESEEATDVQNLWCEKCDNILLEEGEWNDKSENFANIQVVCIQCFEELKNKNVGINF